LSPSDAICPRCSDRLISLNQAPNSNRLNWVAESYRSRIRVTGKSPTGTSISARVPSKVVRLRLTDEQVPRVVDEVGPLDNGHGQIASPWARPLLPPRSKRDVPLPDGSVRKRSYAGRQTRLRLPEGGSRSAARRVSTQLQIEVVNADVRASALYREGNLGNSGRLGMTEPPNYPLQPTATRHSM
jgi:hypothetical protein